ncbi:hypothetical protein LTR36_007455 [Oleoguttula mirabilis]|uniref:Uncharacterized protein n=1 Tax=Oleoguttula mirabilis TaxID=1507867 RepID=A0AAV9J9T1_9PEZI|nr:hypothetical protein LTR36_007455 [Oleoguttula mirabilis]
MPSSLPTSIFRRSTTNGSRWRPERRTGKLSSEQLDIWEHAALLYHGYEWQDAVDAFQYLAQQISDRDLRTVCTLNAGIIQARLGDFADAAQTIEAAAKGDQTFTLTPYLLGVMEWELGNIIKAEACLELCFRALHGGDVAYIAYGLDFVLQADNVRRQLNTLKDSIRLSGVQKDTLLVSAFISAECIFEPPPRSTKPRSSTLDETHKSVGQSNVNKRHTSPDIGGGQHFSVSIAKSPINAEEVRIEQTLPSRGIACASPTSVKPPSGQPPASLPVAPYHTSWRRRPSTPYVARDARGEYGSLRELTQFIQRHRKQLVPLEPRDARGEQVSTRDLARFINTSGRERSGVLLPKHVRGEPILPSPTTISGHASGITEMEFAPSDKSAVMAIASGAEKKTILRRYSGPSSLVPSPLFRGRSIYQSEPDTPTMIRRLSAPDMLYNDQPSSDETLELLLPKVYDPNAKTKDKAVDMPSRRSLQLLDREEQPRAWNPLGNLHTAASSTSELFRDSMMTIDRIDLARTEALRALEGRPRAGAGVAHGARVLAAPNTPAKPLPPGPNVNRFESMIGGPGEQIRVASSKIFGYISRA